MKKDLTLASIIEECGFRLERGPRELNKFLNNLTGGDEPEKANPVYAFQWGESAIAESVEQREIARLKDFAEVLAKRVSDGETTEEEALNQIVGYYNREMFQKARSTSRSTSPLSNMIEDFECVITAKIAGWLAGEGFSGF